MVSIPLQPLAQRLLLNGLAGVGPVTVRRLLEAFGNDLSLALAAPCERLQRIKGITKNAAEAIARREFDWEKELSETERLGFRLLTEESPAWPASLAQLWDPPLVLYAEGAQVPDARSVSIIGSRHCTPYGASLARSLGRDLAKEGWWIVSGLARGIDTAAHEGALDAAGKTVAVLGHGLDLTYPPEALKLRRRIVERGCILSEFPLGRPADRQSFPQRNRIVAALARTIIVVETDIDGGSMITARFAGDLGKTICAFPGRADSPASRGCHALIRDGATLVSGVDEILEELGESRGCPALPLATEAPEHVRWLRHFAGGTAHDAESLATTAHCAIAEAAVMLTLLEIRGILTRRPDGRHERI
ncbi:MAG: DNA-processing protein DprA [Verrucomicrobia bacterium]|nr:DNA-processing protein DprA [Verrucomicrobiota bacterium]